MMILSVSNVIVGIIAVVLVMTIFLIGYIFLFTSVNKNKSIKILNINDADETLKKKYGNKLLDLIEGDFISKIETEYKEVTKLFTKISCDENILYKNNYQEGKKILLTIDMNNRNDHKSSISMLHVHGSNVRNGKSLLFTIFESIDKIIKKDDLKLNLSILLLYQDSDKIFSSLNERYDIIVNENSEILDPITSKLRSYYAFIGVVSTGSVRIDFSSEKVGDGKTRINEFIKEVSNAFNKSILSKPIINVIKTVGKDMIFSDRIIALNPQIFPTFAKNLMNESRFEFIRGTKNIIRFEEVITNEDKYSCVAKIDLAINKNLVFILKRIETLLTKYGISYQVLNNINQSQCVDCDNKEYKTFKETIENVYKKIYCSPSITKGTKVTDYLSGLTDCMISFSPLYYSHNARVNYSKEIEYVSCGSLVYAIDFYIQLLEEYRRRNKCIVNLVEEN